MNINTKIKLNNGTSIPQLGLGTWKCPPNIETVGIIKEAILKGYRHFDTAAVYHNEEYVGKAIRECGIPREELFITTKLWNDDTKFPEEALKESLRKLQLNYIDLYLIHWPVDDRIKTWEALEKFYTEGKCKAIGVSNFTVEHLKELMEKTNIVPAINQVEFNTFLYQKKLLEFCNKNGIALEAYCPLARAKKFDDKRLISIAKKHNKTTAQIMLRWALQHNLIIIPKTMHKERLIENAEIFNFHLDKEDMDTLNNCNENLRNCWDPTTWKGERKEE
jgi:methylglyoxal/glyoxal reductase